MKASYATLEVKQEGQKARLFRFTETEITIGFTSRSHLFLDGHATNPAEVSILTGPQPCVLRPKSNPGTFQLNGTPCIRDMIVKTGDIIASNGFRITVRDLPQVAGPARPDEVDPDTGFIGSDENTHASILKDGQPDGVVNESQTRAVAPEAKKAVEKTAKSPGEAGASYLYLFFAPVQKYLQDDDVSEILINGARQIFIERKGKLVPVTEKFASERALQAAVMNVARSVGRFFDTNNPRLDARLPDGSRVHAVMPPLARAGTIVAIRKFRSEKLTLQQLVDFGSISAGGAQLLNAVVKTGRNLIVSGATSSGKTSVLNVLSALIPDHDRILVLEDASELQLQQAHQVCFETRKMDEHGKGEVSIRDLLHSALRLRPDRIVVGEIRGGEALDLLQAMNTGHEGCMSTIHANSAGDSLRQLETCALLCGVELPLSALREQVASAIQVVIQTARLHDGTRKITGVTEVLGLKDSQYELRDIYFFKTEGISPDGKILGQHVFTGYEPTFFPVARQMGIEVAALIPK